MPKHGFKLALCVGLTGMALFNGPAQALSAQECGALPDNQFLAAVERGTCFIDIQTAAGPDASFTADSGGDGGDDGHNGRNNEGGGHRDGGGNKGGDGDGGNGSGGRSPGAKP